MYPLPQHKHVHMACAYEGFRDIGMTTATVQVAPSTNYSILYGCHAKYFSSKNYFHNLMDGADVLDSISCHVALWQYKICPSLCKNTLTYDPGIRQYIFLSDSGGLMICCAPNMWLTPTSGSREDKGQSIRKCACIRQWRYHETPHNCLSGTGVQTKCVIMQQGRTKRKCLDIYDIVS